MARNNPNGSDHEPACNTMTDEELTAFAMQMADELPPEQREAEVAVKEKDPNDGPSALENFEIWKTHPAARARRRRGLRLVLAAAALLLALNLRVPVKWFLPAAEDIARVELNVITADGGADPGISVDAKNPAELPEALAPLYGGLRFSIFPHEYTWDHFRAVFHLQNGETVIFSLNWKQIILVCRNGLTLELEAAAGFGPDPIFESDQPDSKLAHYWKENGAYHLS